MTQSASRCVEWMRFMVAVFALSLSCREDEGRAS
jgi:hypothetical protein